MALVAVSGCWVAFWAPAGAQGQAFTAEPAARRASSAAADASPSAAIDSGSPSGVAGSDPAPEGLLSDANPQASVSDPAPDASGSASIPEAPTAEPKRAVDYANGLGHAAAAVRRAWRAPAENAIERNQRARRAALQFGMDNFDPGARALIGPKLLGAGLEHAKAAVALSPDLPAARMALAHEIWMEGDSPIAAARAAFGALLAIPRHFEASVWFTATILYVCTLALIAGGLLTLVIYGSYSFLHAAHDIGDLIPFAMPSYARAALLGSAMLLPLALRQGLLGFALTCFAVALIYGVNRQRIVLCVAVAAVLVGAYPMARLTGVVLSAYVDNPLEAAIFASEGFALPADLLRLEHETEADPLAAMALAVATRRAGDPNAADARYERLIVQQPSNHAGVNNAANVKLELGDMEEAISLYRNSLAKHRSATVLFNLYQAQGLAFKLDDVGSTLAEAQRLDSERTAELTLLQGSDLARFTIDLPIPRRALWDRILSSQLGDSFADELRAAIAPGALGRDLPVSAGAFVSVALLSLLAASRSQRSHWCDRCGRRMCPRCDPELGRGSDCESCNRLFQQPETTDRALRAARVSALRFREQRLSRARLIVSVFVPGTAGALAGAPWAGFIGALSGAVAILAFVWRNGVAPDPLTAGAAAPIFFGVISALALTCYGISIAFAITAQRRG